MMKSDIEIAEATKKIKIKTIAKKYGILNKYLINYGDDKAKVDLKIMNDLPNKNGKLVLVTSINPTPYGEGKTTVVIGLTDALNKLGYKAVAALREPSMGPVFGIKGGATGGGYSQVMPMADINLSFTGDMHAITSANDLLCAIVDNHIYQGNSLHIKKVIIPRCLDLNDRALRTINITSKRNERTDSFCITVATEIMAILCLSKDFKDLKRRLAKIIVGYDEEDKPIYVKDLKATASLAIILKDAINPNIVETLEHNLAIIHGGPFANIAHGCNSIIATNLGLRLGDYTVTEAGFGSDLGAEKFLDIACPKGNFKPDAIVLNVTIRALKHHGGCPKESLNEAGMTYLKAGISNLEAHIDSLKNYHVPMVIAINRFKDDAKEEIDYIINYAKNKGLEAISFSTFLDGSKGGLKLAQAVVNLTKESNNYATLYQENLSIKEKIKKICQNIYHANDVIYSEEALQDLAQINKLNVNNYPVCIAKTQYSLSDNKDLLGYPKDFVIHIRKVYVNNGAEFIVCLTDNILTMPGLGKESAYLKMTIDDNKVIRGLS
jgi:formate--tetrahydrofolate ligase